MPLRLTKVNADVIPVLVSHNTLWKARILNFLLYWTFATSNFSVDRVRVREREDVYCIKQPESRYSLSSELHNTYLDRLAASYLYRPVDISQSMFALLLPLWVKFRKKDFSFSYLPVFSSLHTRPPFSWLFHLVFDGIPTHFITSISREPLVRSLCRTCHFCQNYHIIEGIQLIFSAPKKKIEFPFLVISIGIRLNCLTK